MKKHKTVQIIGLCILMLISCKSNSQKIDMDYSTVSHVELEKYKGKWYEIARFNHRFERGLVGVTATYSVLPDGKIKVVNAGYKNTLNGKFKTANAKAKIPDASQPGKLKVYFIPFYGANYNIMELNENYQWALVGSSSPKYLWILSRTPKMDEEIYNLILAKAKKRGYAVDELIKVEQSE